MKITKVELKRTYCAAKEFLDTANVILSLEPLAPGKFEVDFKKMFEVLLVAFPIWKSNCERAADFFFLPNIFKDSPYIFVPHCVPNVEMGMNLLETIPALVRHKDVVTIDFPRTLNKCVLTGYLKNNKLTPKVVFSFSDSTGLAVDDKESKKRIIGVASTLANEFRKVVTS